MSLDLVKLTDYTATRAVDTGATSTKQCEAITNVAIRVMRLKRDGFRTKQDRLRDNTIPVLYCRYSTGIILDYSNIVYYYARYYLTCMHEYGYSLLWYGISTYC